MVPGIHVERMGSVSRHHRLIRSCTWPICLTFETQTDCSTATFTSFLLPLSSPRSTGLSRKCQTWADPVGDQGTVSRLTLSEWQLHLLKDQCSFFSQNDFVQRYLPPLKSEVFIYQRSLEQADRGFHTFIEEARALYFRNKLGLAFSEAKRGVQIRLWMHWMTFRTQHLFLLHRISSITRCSENQILPWIWNFKLPSVASDYVGCALSYKYGRKLLASPNTIHLRGFDRTYYVLLDIHQIHKADAQCIHNGSRYVYKLCFTANKNPTPLYQAETPLYWMRDISGSFSGCPEMSNAQGAGLGCDLAFTLHDFPQPCYRKTSWAVWNIKLWVEKSNLKRYEWMKGWHKMSLWGHVVAFLINKASKYLVTTSAW